MVMFNIYVSLSDCISMFSGCQSSEAIAQAGTVLGGPRIVRGKVVVVEAEHLPMVLW